MRLQLSDDKFYKEIIDLRFMTYDDTLLSGQLRPPTFPLMIHMT